MRPRDADGEAEAEEPPPLAEPFDHDASRDGVPPGGAADDVEEDQDSQAGSLHSSLCGTDEPARWPARPQDAWLQEQSGGRTPVGLFGGCEVVIHNGPVFVGEQYEVTRTLVAKGETPKTEFEWVRSVLKDTSGRVIAEMTLQQMMLKGSFEGYDELRAQSDARARAASTSASTSKL